MDGMDAFVFAVFVTIACAIGSIIYWAYTFDGQFMAYSWILLIVIIAVGIYWGDTVEEKPVKVK